MDICEENIDFLCAMCDTQLLFGVQQEYGQVLTTSEPLYVYGECPRCNEVYAIIYVPDLEETELLITQPTQIS